MTNKNKFKLFLLVLILIILWKSIHNETVTLVGTMQKDERFTVAYNYGICKKEFVANVNGPNINEELKLFSLFGKNKFDIQFEGKRLTLDTFYVFNANEIYAFGLADSTSHANHMQKQKSLKDKDRIYFQRYKKGKMLKY